MLSFIWIILRMFCKIKPDLPLSVWVSPVEAQVSSGPSWGQRVWLQQTWEAWHVSPAIEPPSRQPVNWRMIIPKKFSHRCKSSRAQNKFPNLGIWQRNWEPPRNLTLKVNGTWLQNFYRTGETDSWRAQTKPCVHQEKWERSCVPTRNWARLVCECPGVSTEGISRQWPSMGTWAQNITVTVSVLLKEATVTPS